MPTYRIQALKNAEVAEVQPDLQRLFLVVAGTRPRDGRPWTLVLERQNDFWISRRDLGVRMDPEAAVSGFLFDREGTPDPLHVLRRMNEVVRVEYYQVLQEKMKGDRIRNELTRELSALREECDALRRQLRHRSERAEGPGRRISGEEGKKPSTPRRRRRLR